MFLKKFVIPLVVFITGGCVLVIEVVGIRLLSPYFGNTIFTVSSVISVVLAALSLGYYAGGKIADKYPKETLFYSIIAAGGLSVIILYLVGLSFLSFFSYKISIVTGPIIASLILFFLQNFLLGMLSPFAIKLQSLRQEGIGVGNASGQIFFWSTLGSIAGSLTAGFILIPNVGVDKIMLGTGLVLLVLGVFANLPIHRWFKLTLVIVGFISVPYLLIPLQTDRPGVLYSKDS